MDDQTAIRVIEGGTLGDLPGWLGSTIANVIQQLKEASHAKENIVDNVQILLEVIDECKLILTTVAKEGEGNLRLRQDELERERWRKKRYDFCKQTWQVVHCEIADRKQELWPYIHHDVEAQLGNRCEMFRTDFGDQLGRLKDVQQQMAQCMDNIVSVVDTRLLQNDRRNNLQ